MTQVRTFLGQPYPLGATWMGNGVNFAIFSEHASGVELCLVDKIEDATEYVRIPIKECTDHDLLANNVAGIHFYTLNRSDATRMIFDSLGIPRHRNLQASSV